MASIAPLLFASRSFLHACTPNKSPERQRAPDRLVNFAVSNSLVAAVTVVNQFLHYLGRRQVSYREVRPLGLLRSLRSPRGPQSDSNDGGHDCHAEVMFADVANCNFATEAESTVRQEPGDGTGRKGKLS
jgi:hypothetical protein